MPVGISHGTTPEVEITLTASSRIDLLVIVNRSANGNQFPGPLDADCKQR
jgi:hypothetical protein